MDREPYSYCLNTSTIRGQSLPLPEMAQVVAEAGYDGIEPWIRELDAYAAAGGEPAELGRQIADAGLVVPNVIGFFEWAVDDAPRRAVALEEARRCMGLCLEIGCRRIAAPPSGITDAEVPLDALAERYAALLAVGLEMGVVPMVEFWGASRTLSTLGEAVHVAIESGYREACVLADIFHMHRSGSPYNGLHLVGPSTIGLVHINDYPAQPDRAQLTDADRLYPGDGAAPIVHILRDLAQVGYDGHLSLELFNADYWAAPAAEVAATGLRKMRRLAAEALT